MNASFNNAITLVTVSLYAERCNPFFSTSPGPPSTTATPATLPHLPLRGPPAPARVPERCGPRQEGSEEDVTSPGRAAGKGAIRV